VELWAFNKENCLFLLFIAIHAECTIALLCPYQNIFPTFDGPVRERSFILADRARGRQVGEIRHDGQEFADSWPWLTVPHTIQGTHNDDQA